jgi:hypothetical protein
LETLFGHATKRCPTILRIGQRFGNRYNKLHTIIIDDVWEQDQYHAIRKSRREKEMGGWLEQRSSLIRKMRAKRLMAANPTVAELANEKLRSAG